MQIKLFTISVGDSGSALQEMNTFLRGKSLTPDFSRGTQAAPPHHTGL